MDGKGENRPGRPRSWSYAYRSGEGGPGGKVVVGPLLGIPLLVFSLVFALLLAVIAIIFSIFGGRRIAAALLRRAGLGGRMPHGRGGDPDVIDVESEVIDPPHEKNE